MSLNKALATTMAVSLYDQNSYFFHQVSFVTVVLLALTLHRVHCFLLYITGNHKVRLSDDVKGISDSRHRVGTSRRQVQGCTVRGLYYRVMIVAIVLH